MAKEELAVGDKASTFGKIKAAVLGVSRDGVASRDKFEQEHGLGFTRASDDDGKVSAVHGTWVEKSMYGRTYMGMGRSTFLIGCKGTIRGIWGKLKVPDQVADALEARQAL